MNHDDLAFFADGISIAEPPATAANLDEPLKSKPLKPSDAVNWLRYLAKCKQHLAQATYGPSEQTLSFQAHVMREAARHLETLTRERGLLEEWPRSFEPQNPPSSTEGVLSDVRSGLGYD